MIEGKSGLIDAKSMSEDIRARVFFYPTLFIMSSGTRFKPSFVGVMRCLVHM